MIKFFRHIRKSLLMENLTAGQAGKTGRYFKYAIGEIVLVVIGILIALSINNWNQSRKQDIAEKEFIEGVKNDLKQDKEYIKLVVEMIEPKVEAYQRINKELPKLYDEDKKTLDSLFQVYFSSQRTFYPISGSFQAAISGNEINNYKNKKATRSIIKLYNSTYDRLIDNARMYDERWDYLSRMHSHIRRTGEFREMNTAKRSDLLDDMFYHFIQMQWYQNMLNETIAEIDTLLQQE